MASVTKKLAATNTRNFRTFLLMQQFEAQEIGARIAQARNERGLKQEDLAGMASFSKRSLQDYEAGITIPYRHLQELSKLLKKPADWFLYGETEVTQPRDQEEAAAELKAAAVELRDALGEIGSLLRDLKEWTDERRPHQGQP